MKKGFTLIELLLVVGLMAMMATLAISSYSALTRGMSDRAAIDVTKSIERAAVERARLDGKKTYIFLFDEVTKLDTEMSAGSCQGLIVAVRAGGRISAVSGNCYGDEFGLEKMAEVSSRHQQRKNDERNATTRRLYNIATRNYANVYEGNFTIPLILPDLEGEDSTENGNADSENNEGVDREMTIYGFEKKDGDATFKVGDLYGQEFAISRMPPNYIFGSQVNMKSTANLRQNFVRMIEIESTSDAIPDIKIYHRKPDGSFQSIGSTSMTKDGD